MKALLSAKVAVGVTILSLFSSIALADDGLSLVVPGKTIELSSDEWAKAYDETGFAKNYDQKKLSPWHKFGRMITVYLIPMSEDRRAGSKKISDREYLEFFIVHPGFVTVQTLVDKGEYWVMCRETFNPKDGLLVDVSSYEPFPTEKKLQLLWQTYQAEVDETRYLINSQF
jgi:hypothetical protein